MRKDDVFPSKYLKAADLKDKPITLTIASANYETLKNHKGEEQKKIVVGFLKTNKTLPLNLTNFDAIVDATGLDDGDDWVGCKIQLYPSEVQVGSEMKDCIRIRASEQAAMKMPKPNPPQADNSDNMDDEIPF
jgi:hypothetical protein